jgi:hypothetical protein
MASHGNERRNKIMSRRLQTLPIIALILLLGCTQISFARGKAKDNLEERLLTGLIVKLDRKARTMVVEDGKTGKTVTYRVPAKQLIYIRNFSGFASAVPFERVMRGMTLNMRVVVETGVEQNLAKSE